MRCSQCGADHPAVQNWGQRQLVEEQETDFWRKFLCTECSEMLTHVAMQAVAMDCNGRARKGSAKMPSTMWLMGTAVGKEAGAAGWMVQQNCWVLLARGAACWVVAQGHQLGSWKVCAMRAVLVLWCPLL